MPDTGDRQDGPRSIAGSSRRQLLAALAAGKSDQRARLERVVGAEGPPLGELDRRVDRQLGRRRVEPGEEELEGQRPLADVGGVR